MGAAVKIIDKDTGWGSLFKAAASLRGKRYAKVGVLADSQKGGAEYPTGGLTVAEVAAIMEYGTQPDANGHQHVPERSFVRSTFDEQREALEHLSGEVLVRVITGNISADQGIGILGAKLADEMKKKIAAGIDPENAPSTIARKGSSKPLVDTGRLLGAITWAIAWGGDGE